MRTNDRELVLNAVCGKNGYLRVEATDADDNVLEGCPMDDCDTFTGDDIRHRVAWQGQSRIPHQGTLRLRFRMRNASLYSFGFR